MTERDSVDSSGVQGNGISGNYGALAISADGRFVAFSSGASNLVPGDTNGWIDVFVRDRQSGATERVSVDSAGQQANGYSGSYSAVSISADGRFVAFTSYASNLVPGDTNGWNDVFVRDRLLGTTERVSVDSTGAQANERSGVNGVSISADGRYVAFQSAASNLVSGDVNGCSDVFVHDRQTGITERVSLGLGGAESDDSSGYYGVSISADGRFVSFDSDADNLVVSDWNTVGDIFVYDRQLGVTERVSVDSGGTQGSDVSQYPSISGDGRYVAFWSIADNLVPGDTNLRADIFLRDRQSGTTERVSVDSSGSEANDRSYYPSISADGRYVAFMSFATNLVPADTNGLEDIFVHDRQNGATVRVNVDSTGAQANDSSGAFGIALSADGRCVAFPSYATNLVPGDTNGQEDVFLHDVTSFTSMCDPGIGAVIACPCSNPPAATGRGCDNSSSTGGAALAAGGLAYLSIDSLGFTTSGERPSATSLLLQGNALIPTGFVFGQGVRCVGGALKRLFLKVAVNGSISAPDPGVGDLTVSARSALLGDPIQAGQTRYYLVYYRDPIVLGGCPASSGFNATQTGAVTWWP